MSAETSRGNSADQNSPSGLSVPSLQPPTSTGLAPFTAEISNPLSSGPSTMEVPRYSPGPKLITFGPSVAMDFLDSWSARAIVRNGRALVPGLESSPCGETNHVAAEPREHWQHSNKSASRTETRSMTDAMPNAGTGQRS